MRTCRSRQDEKRKVKKRNVNEVWTQLLTLDPSHVGHYALSTGR